nr:type IX secretion system sortase PorU [Bacteroidota bacterium]
MKIKLLLIVFFIGGFSFAQKDERIIIKWKGQEEMVKPGGEKIKVLNFVHAQINESSDYFPVYFNRFKVNTAAVNATLINEVYETFKKEEIEGVKNLDKIGNSVKVDANVGYDRKEPYALVHILPVRQNPSTGSYEKLISATLVLSPDGGAKSGRSSRNYAPYSVLSTGDWYKFGVAKDGIFKIDYDFLKKIGINPEELDPRKIQIYGNGGGMLSMSNALPRIDDLAENAILVSGEGDGVFDKDDFILFYGQSQHRWKLMPSGYFEHEVNRYSDSTYYFLTISAQDGKRINDRPSNPGTANKTVTTFDGLSFHEKDIYNLLKSGRAWYGEKFEHVTSQDFTFNIPNIDASVPVYMKAEVVAKSTSPSSFTFSSSGSSFVVSMSAVILGEYGQAAAPGSVQTSFNSNASNIAINLTYSKPLSSSIGWLDYISLNARRHLKMDGKQMLFMDKNSVGAGNIAEFILSSGNDRPLIWDVTDPYNIKRQLSVVSGNNIVFRASADTVRAYMAFTGDDYLNPVFAGKIENQNLHGMGQPQMIIIAHPLFLNPARELANFHISRGLNTEVVTTTQIYNEFSSGSPDLSAGRDFVKMVYDRARNQNELPKYLLLFGDGSYDNKGRSSTNTNFVFTFQSRESLRPLYSYVTDDFYGLLDDDEGEWTYSHELVDIGIGRFPVKTLSEAQNMVKKVKSYYDSNTKRDWRNMISFIADDEDNNQYVKDSEGIINGRIKSSNPNYNIEKVYLDAYQQISTPGGQRYPEVNEAIDRRMERGGFIVNYIGHGGEVGLAHERVITVPQINAWKNSDRLPLFVTATCSFSPFDDPAFTSAGEQVFLNPAGGAIALLTTTRVVFASANRRLNDLFYSYCFEKINGEAPRLGDIFRLTKMASGYETNTLNFTLLGDPALELAFPKYNVVTSTIKGNDVKTTVDTIRALEKVTITGYVSDLNGQKLSGFNGVVYPTVYDKEKTAKTLANDAGSDVQDFQIRNNILYKGKVSVKSGEFTFTFVVPKDIVYEYGYGRISYYAENGVDDGHGFFEDFIIGGTNPNAATDEEGPIVELYMNNDKFVFGGMTNENPNLVAFLEDESGINTVGNGVGHDLTAILDENTDKAIVLNDYYEADMDSYQKGSIKYPLSKLTEGKHTLKLKVWDVYNNSSEAYTEFVVVNSADLALKHVLN